MLSYLQYACPLWARLFPPMTLTELVRPPGASLGVMGWEQKTCWLLANGRLWSLWMAG